MTGLGWRVSAVRRTQNLEERYAASRAAIALIDLRGEKRPVPLAARLGGAARAVGGALVAVIEKEQWAHVSALTAAGVTHFLMALDDDARWTAALAGGFELARRLRNEEMPVPVPDKGVDGHDFLTGLADRRSALVWLEKALPQGRVAAVMLLSLSQFESINAAYGAVVGDTLLARVAGRARRIAQEAAVAVPLVARVGGAEYLLALGAGEGEDSAGAAQLLAQRLLAAIGQPFLVGERPVRLTARCGIAEALAADDAGRLLRRASAALADARRSGTSEIAIRSADRRGRGVDADRLDADLRLALERGEIGIVYQPQYASVDDRIVGVEALARWNHPQLGQLDAGLLFGAAERSDTLLPVSRHIQQRALEEAAHWPGSLADLRLAINVTAVDLAQEDFVDTLFGMIARSGFPPERLTVEITETGLIENIRRAGELMRALRQRGVRVAIDDFGTGYSSLAYLKALHPDYLKMDSGLTRDIAGNARDRVIVRGIIAMAHSLALTVVAEGVETEQQLALLAQEGCAVYQGFLRSRPLDSAALAALF